MSVGHIQVDVKIGIIGIGKMGINHLRIFSQLRGVKIVGIADINEPLLKATAEEFSTHPFTNYKDLLDLVPDAVSIVVPTSLHKQVAIDALNAGCHILLEKPIANTVEEGREIINCAIQNKRKLLVGHIERFNPAVNILKEIIDDGILGDIVSISSKRVGPYQPRITDCGIILDLAPHDIDIISYLYSDRVKEVFAIAGKTFHRYEDHASIMLKFRNNNAGIIETSWLPPRKIRKLNVVGDQGVASLDFIEQTVVVYDKNWAREANVNKKEPLKNELLYFLSLISNGDTPVVTGEDSLHALAVALAAVEAYRTGRIMRIPEVGGLLQPQEKLSHLKFVRGK